MARRHLALLAGAIALAPGAPALAAGSSAPAARPGPLAVVAPRVPVPWPASRSVPVRPARVVHLELALRPSHPARIAELLAGLYDPSSPSYRRFLPRGAFVRRFRPSARSLGRLRSYLARRGLSSSARGFALSVRGPAHAVEQAFGTRLVHEADGAGAPTAAAGPFLLPRALAGTVSGVLGARALPAAATHLLRVRLAREPAPAERATAGPLGAAARAGTAAPRARIAQPRVVPAACPAASAIAAANQAVTLNALGAHYGIDPLLAAGDDGGGETVAVYELGAYSSTAVAAYLACEGISTSVASVPVDGGAVARPGGATTEADLDVEQVATQAPGASILAYEGPDSATGEYDVWARIIGDDRASVVSTSWGLCEPDAAGGIPGEATLFEQAAAQGQTIVAASGDSGAEDCWPSGQNAAAVDFPASDPYVTGVGGTTLSGGGDVVWNDCPLAAAAGCAQPGRHATGGGLSAVFAEPAWQQPLLAQAAGPCRAAACRGVPDLSANAGTTEVIYDAGGWAGAGGTSAAAPLVAGLVADLADTCTARLGALDPGLYAEAAAGAYGVGLTDVTSGENDLTGASGGRYAAGPRYDLASGLGTPIGAGLACPSAAAVSPPSAPAGARVTLAGEDLTHATIEFGGAPARVVQAGATSATVVVPSGAGSVAVRALSPLGTGRVMAGFRYAPPSGAGAPTSAAGATPGGPPSASSAPGSSVAGPEGPSAGLTGSPAASVPAAPAAPAGAPRQVRASVRGRLVALRWRRAAGFLEGYVLTVRACAIGQPCRLRRLLLAARRTTAALHLAPGRYALSLEAVGRAGASARVRRWVQVHPPARARVRPRSRGRRTGREVRRP